ncbi:MULTISPECIES: SRPBCC family protein [unclassified Streptomyces]|uniref:SRPBCC family protein n=1 Tax=unclassified Streptomyces TaxID=2593676 RepID=UPI0019033237|nr:SRPBCC family protein [Streptomyces sp. HSG2]
MVTFFLERTAPLPPREAWRRITRWHHHGATVPLTRVTVVTPPPSGPGTRIVARTGLGPIGFDDPMDVTTWRPPDGDRPGLCRLEKRGRLVTGWAELEVRPAPGDRSRVGWREEVEVRGFPSALDGLVARSGRALFGREVDRLLRLP